MTSRQLRAIWAKTGGCCHFCGDEVRLTARGWKRGSMDAAPRGTWEIDHVAQRAKGGARSADNSLPACLVCNRLRWHRTGKAIRESPSPAWRTAFLHPPRRLVTARFTPELGRVGVHGTQVVFRSDLDSLALWLRRIDRWIAYANSVLAE